MNKDIWYDHFLKSLYEKYPKKGKLAEALMDLLCIEREAAYRRLRKDVAFPFQEILKIAFTWNISLNEIVGINAKNVPFFMRQLSYLNPSEMELDALRETTQVLQKVIPSFDNEYMEICNKLPRSLIANFTSLNKFYLFKWEYQYGNEETALPYFKTIIPEKMHKAMVNYYMAIKNVTTLNYIFDHMLFDFLVCDVRYFHSIKLITDEEKELIKQDIHSLLDYMSEVASKGYYKVPENKVNIYISRINIDTNYSYLYTKLCKICRIHVFSKYEIYSTDIEMVNRFKKWMQLKKRTSIQISEVDEIARIEYFTRQRQLVDSL